MPFLAFIATLFSKGVTAMKKLWIILLSVVLFFSIIIIACQAMLFNYQAERYEQTIATITDNLSNYSTMFEIDSYIREYYMGEIDDEKLSKNMIDGYLYGLGDRYAYYYSPSDFDSYTNENNGRMTGIGVRVIYDNTLGGIYILSVNEDGPALKSGIMPKDIIVGVDGEAISDIGYYEAINRIKAGEAGSTVKLSIARAPDYANIEELTVTRENIKNTTVECELIYDDVGFISISEFNKTTSNELTLAVEQMISSGAKSLVFDVRNNPGGDLDGVAGALDYLLPEGPIIHIVSKQGVDRTLYSDAKCVDMPMAVLCNASTASAGELFTCALKDYKKAVVVGTVTFGKGSMQTIVPLSNGGGVSFTTNRYDPPFSENYDGVGVTPDIEIDLTEELYENYYLMTHDEDIQLQAALEALGKK